MLGEKHCVTVLKTSPNNNQLAVGYDDGVVRLFDLASGECSVTFSGHKSPVNCLAFDTDGMRLASGSKDTNIIIWDVVAEAGMFRLSGHKGPITQCCFLEKKNLLVSCSTDTLIKFWDLDTQHCFKTLVGHRSEVWDMAILKEDKFLVSGCGDSELRVWKIHFADEEDSPTEETSGSKRLRTNTEGGDEDENGDEGVEEDDSILRCTKIGTILRQGRDRLASMVTDSNRNLLACHGMDSTVELFRFHDQEEVDRLMTKRRRKFKKQNPNAKEDEIEALAVTLQDQVLRIKSVQASAKCKVMNYKRNLIQESHWPCYFLFLLFSFFFFV